MLQEENEAYGPDTPSYQQGQFEPVAVLENPTDTHASAEQDTSPLPVITSDPKASLPPQNRQGRGERFYFLHLCSPLSLEWDCLPDRSTQAATEVVQIVQPPPRRQ